MPFRPILIKPSATITDKAGPISPLLHITALSLDVNIWLYLAFKDMYLTEMDLFKQATKPFF
jgi:hypothetical protein